MTATRCAAALAIIALAGCGGGSSPVTTAPPAGPASATVQRVDGLQASDIWANLIGCSITVPAMHELQLAVVVNRDGAYSAKDSHVTRHATPGGQAFPVRIISFLPQGPLRPDAKDLLVLVDGWQIRHAETQRGSTSGSSGDALLAGQPYQQIAFMVHGGDQGGWSADVRSPANVALGVHVYARIVPVVPGHPRWTEMQAHPGASYSSSGPLNSLDEILPPAATATPAPGSF